MNHLEYHSRKLKTANMLLNCATPSRSRAFYIEPSRALKNIYIYGIYDNDVEMKRWVGSLLCEGPVENSTTRVLLTPCWTISKQQRIF